MASNSESPKYNKKIESKTIRLWFRTCVCRSIRIIYWNLYTFDRIIIGAIIGTIIGFIIMSTSKITVTPISTSANQPIQTTATFNGIDETYFNIVQDHGDKLFLFIQEITDDPRLKKRDLQYDTFPFDRQTHRNSISRSD